LAERKPATTSFRIPANTPEQLMPIASELVRIEESCRYSQQGQFEQSKIWHNTNLWLGIPAAFTAAVAGTAILVSEEWQLVAGVLSLASAALATTITTLSAERRSDRAATAANAYRDIQTETRQLLLVDLRNLEFEEAREKLRNLTDRYGEVSRGAEPILKKAYKRAKGNLAGGGQTHQVDTLESK
jgi:hypothetical protein